MAKRKVCTTCKLFVEAETCPVCKGNQFSSSFQGRIFINNPETSLVAKKLGIAHRGEYAIKVK